MVNQSGDDYTIHIHGKLSNRASKLAFNHLLLDMDNYMLFCRNGGRFENKQKTFGGNTMTFEKIQAIIMDQLDKEAEEVTLETNFREDLDADSLDLFQIINDIEDAFDIKIESDEGIDTVGSLAAYVDAQLA